MSEDQNMPNDPSVINDAEVIETLGNMFLVKINGEMRQVPATYKNELLYEHELYELLHPDAADERVILTDSNESDFLAIAPTDNDSVYQIWVSDNPYPVMNPPSMAEDVLQGVRDAVSEPVDYQRLKNVYQEIRSTRVRRTVMERAASLFPQNEVIPNEEGWSILGLFTLTWDSRVFLNTGDDIDNKTSYRVAGSGVSETDSARQFLQLAIRDEIIEQYRDLDLKVHYPLDSSVDVTESDTTQAECPTCEHDTAYQYYDDTAEQQERPVNVCASCDQPWQEFDLTEREIEFIGKAQWLINHRQNLDDDAFWDVVESYVWHNP